MDSHIFNLHTFSNGTIHESCNVLLLSLQGMVGRQIDSHYKAKELIKQVTSELIRDEI